jgi:hypothetical protein
MADLLDYLKILGPGVGASAATNLLPDLNSEGIAGYIPGTGLAQRLAGFVGQAYDAGATLSNAQLGTNLPPAPAVLGEWGQRAAGTEDKVYDWLGGKKPETPTEELLRSGASGAGAMMFPGMGPSGLLKMGMVGGTLGAGQHAALEAVAPEPTTTHEAIPADVAQFLGTPAQPDVPPDVAHFLGVQPTASTIPPDVATFLGETPGQQPPAPGQAPPFSELGPSGMTQGQAAVIGAFSLFGVVAGRRAANWGARISKAASDARAADPAYAKAMRDYEDSVVRRGGSEIGDIDAPEAPLPTANVVQSWLTAAKEYGLDAAEGMQNFARLTAKNPAMAEKLGRHYGTAIDQQLWESKFRQFAMTGHDQVSGVTIPSFLQWTSDAERLGKRRFQDLNATLHARDELDNRAEMAKQRAARGEPPNPVEDRHNFYRQDVTQLNDIITRGMANPRIAELVTRHDMIQQGLIEIARKHGFLTDADAVKIRTAHPNYLPETDREGRILHTIGQRTLSPNGGIEGMTTKATSAMSQHVESLMRDIELNNMRRAYTDHILEWQNSTPGAPQLLYKAMTPPTGPGAMHTPYPAFGSEVFSPREQIIAVRTPTGMQHWRTDNSFLFDGLTGNNITRANIHFDSAGKLRQMLQSGTTGMMSLATGRFVPLRNLMYTALQAPVNASGGLYGGPVAWATRGMLPKTLTALPDMALNVVGALGQYGVNAFARQVPWRLSDLLRPNNPNIATQTIRAIVGDKPLEMASASMRQMYMNSSAYEGAAAGMGGQSLQQRRRMPLYNRDAGSNRTIRLQMGQLEPRILINADGGPSARPFLLNLQRAATDAFTHASEATHDFLYSLNKNNPAFRDKATGKTDQNQLVSAVRSVVGDPSQSGIGRIPQMARTLIPYANVSVQGKRAFGRAVVLNPLDTLGAMMTGYGGLITLSMLTAFQSQSNLLHFTQETTTADRASNLLIYNGKDAEHSLIKIPLSGEVREFFTPMYDMAFHLLNIRGAAFDNMTKDDVLGMLKEWWFHEIDRSTVEGVKHGLNDSWNFLDFPPLIKAGIALGGGHGRIDLSRIITDASTGNLGWNTFITQGMPDALPSTLGPNDAAAHGQDGKRTTELFSSILGLSGSVIADVFRLRGYLAQGNSWMDSLGSVGKDMLQATKDLNPQLGGHFLFENQVRLSVSSPIVEMTRREWKEMEKTSGVLGRPKDPSMTGTDRNALEVPVYETDEGRISEDPLVRQMATYTAGHVQNINSFVMPEIRALEKQLQQVDAMRLDPNKRRDFENETKRDIADKWRQVHDIVVEANGVLSQMAQRPIVLSKGMNWQAKSVAEIQ